MIVLCSGNLNDLVQHGLRALRETLPSEQDLTTKVPQLSPLLFEVTRCYISSSTEEISSLCPHLCVIETCICRLFLRFIFPFFQNVSIGIVGKDMEFVIYDDDDVAPFLEGLEERPQRKVQQGVLGFIKFSLDS